MLELATPTQAAAQTPANANALKLTGDLALPAVGAAAPVMPGQPQPPNMQDVSQAQLPNLQDAYASAWNNGVAQEPPGIANFRDPVLATPPAAAVAPLANAVAAAPAVPAAGAHSPGHTDFGQSYMNAWKEANGEDPFPGSTAPQAVAAPVAAVAAGPAEFVDKSSWLTPGPVDGESAIAAARKNGGRYYAGQGGGDGGSDGLGGGADNSGGDFGGGGMSA